MFGAGTCRLHLRVEMKSAHASEGQHRPHQKVEKLPLTGFVLPLDHWGPSKELLRGRDEPASVLAGVLPKAEPKAFAR
jgi:hypothetical protein